MKPSLLFLLLALLLAVPTSALAVLPDPVEQLALNVQSRALRLGDRGEQVADLQRLLQERGFAPGPIDGRFGPLTLGAVQAAQRAYGLEVDGLAGRLTVGALRQQSAAAPKSPPVQPPPAKSGGLVIYQARTSTAAPAATGPSRERSPATQPGDRSQAVPIPDEILSSISILPHLMSGPVPLSPFAPGPPPAAVAAVARPDGPEPVLALTFNGLPSAEGLDQLLGALAAAGMQATFFVTGEEAEAQPALLRQIEAAGHELANLGYTRLDMTRLSPMTVRAQLRRTQRAITGATGRSPLRFRPPLGRFDRSLMLLAEGEGLELTLWSNVTFRPREGTAPAQLAAELAEAAFPGAVLMLPLDGPQLSQVVAPLLERLSAGGYSSRTLSALPVR